MLKEQVEAGNVADTTAEPHNPILHNPSGLEIDTCGHSDFVQDENGNWWLVFLGRRDNTGPDLARETFLAPVEWIDGWPVVNGGNTITSTMTGPAIDTDWQPNEKPVYFGFDKEELNLHFNFIRNIGEDDYSLTANPGYLTLYAIADSSDGKNAASGNNNGEQPSWVGLRQTEKNAVVTTAVDFQPSNDTDAAGLTMYNTSDNRDGPYNLEFVIMKNGENRKLVVDTGRNVVKAEADIPATGTVYLRMSVVSRTGGADVTMSYSMNNQDWTDVTTLDVANSINRIQYTGVYFGMYASGRGTETRTPAKFDFFTYESSEVGRKDISLTAANSSVSMQVGDTQTIQPAVTATDLVNQKLMYAVTAGQDVISVDQNGEVTALRAGEATLKVVSEYDQSKSVAYIITVTGGSSSGGSSSSGNKTETITNPDGSTTTTVTKPDGSKTETTKTSDGSSSVVNTTKDGQVEAKVTVSSSAVADAEGPVALPLPKVPVTDDLDKAAKITVNLPANTTAKVEIPVEDASAGTVAILVKADGTAEVIKTSVATENSVIVELSNGETVKIVDMSKDFADVPNSFWGIDAVDFVTSHEMFNGTSENTFSPNAEMTRAMIVTVLARLEGVDTSRGDTWYEAGQQWALENGISDGTNMMGSLTREQLAVMLYRYAGTPDVSGTISGFGDTSSISDWAEDAMIWAVQNGILAGNGSNLNPQSNATRAEVATMLMRFVVLTEARNR